MDDRIFNFLSKIDVFSELCTQDLLELSSEFHWETYEEGDLIIEQGQKLDSLYLLYEGSVEKFEKNINFSLRKILGTGSIFGGLSIVTSKPTETTVRCLEQCHILCINDEEFRRILLRWPQIYQGIIRQLINNLNEANQMLSESKCKEDLHQVINLTKYRDKFMGMWGSAKTINEMKQILQELKAKKGNLLILGERGTGRQLLAWYMHQQLFGETAPFMEIEGRHFDEQWGSFLEEPGINLNNHLPNYSLFNIVIGGTLFIKEIDQLSPRTQLKLAQKLRSEPLKCLVVASLRAKSQSTGSSIIPELQECFAHSYLVKPLRERKRDIPIIAQGVLDHLAQENQRTFLTISPETIHVLLSYHYMQANVAELIQVMERAFSLTTEDTVELEQIYFGPASKGIGGSINLLKWKALEKFAKGKAIFWLRRISAIMFVLTIFILFFSPQIMVTTKICAFIWSLWWLVLAVISPLFGRVWCTICPFSTIMNFIQDRFNPKRHVPEVLVKYDYLIMALLFLLIFWVETIAGMRYNPRYTSLLLITLQLAAIGVGILFTRNVWCHHFCPLGGFVGTAAIGSIVEVRADSTICQNKCTTVDCYVGKCGVKGCPMSQHLPYLDNNLNCKLCFNCLRSCPHGSVHFNLRIFAREVWNYTRVNQGYTIFIGVLFTILFPLIYFESVRMTWPAGEWTLLFTIAYFSSALLGSAIAWMIAKPFKTKAASLRIKLFFSLTPLVFAGHIIYQLRFVPGIHFVELGVVVHGESGLHAASIPLMLATQGMTLMIGLGLTLLTIVIILVKTLNEVSH